MSVLSLLPHQRQYYQESPNVNGSHVPINRNPLNETDSTCSKIKKIATPILLLHLNSFLPSKLNRFTAIMIIIGGIANYFNKLHIIKQIIWETLSSPASRNHHRSSDIHQGRIHYIPYYYSGYPPNQPSFPPHYNSPLSNNRRANIHMHARGGLQSSPSPQSTNYNSHSHHYGNNPISTNLHIGSPNVGHRASKKPNLTQHQNHTSSNSPPSRQRRAREKT